MFKNKDHYMKWQ